MKTSTKRALLFVGGLGVTTSLIAGWGHCYHRDPEHRAEWMAEKIGEKLELSDDQKEQLVILKEHLIETRKEMRKGRESALEDILSVLQQPMMDREKALTMIRKRTDAIRERAPQIVDAMGGFYDSLTPAQREKLREHVAQRMEHHRHRGNWGNSMQGYDD